MFTKYDILARLQNGDSVDAIAQEMADALNEAKAAYAEEEARIAKEEAAAKAREEALAAEKLQKREDIKHLTFELAEYLGKYVPNTVELVGQMQDMTDEDYDAVGESIEATIQTFKDLKNFEFKMPKFGFKRESKGLDEDPIFNFLTKKPWLM